MKNSLTRAVALIVAVGLLIIGTSPVASAQSIEETFVIELESDGSAIITVRSVFDLQNDAEREAFESLESDAAAREDAAARFESRLMSVARDAQNATGREMSVTDASIEIDRVDGSDGVVTLTSTWEGLAAVEGDRLVVTEPFASGFEPDRLVTVQAPDGYRIDSVNPPAAEQSESSVSWEAGTTLDGFEVVMTSTGGDGTTADTSQTNGQPGFGMVPAVTGLVVLMLVVRRRL